MESVVCKRAKQSSPASGVSGIAPDVGSSEIPTCDKSVMATTKACKVVLRDVLSNNTGSQLDILTKHCGNGSKINISL